MHFLGPIRGVLPLGPNGVASLNTLQPSPFDTNAAAMISYNYTLNHQGFSSNITCKYDDQSPIRFTPVGNVNMLAYNASCPDLGLATVLTDVVDYPTLNTNNTLTFWACKSVPTDGKEPIYYVYLRGRDKLCRVYWEYHLPCILNTSCNIPGGVSIDPKYFLLRGPNATFATRPLD
jgi:hypothetical protein